MRSAEWIDLLLQAFEDGDWDGVDSILSSSPKLRNAALAKIVQRIKEELEYREVRDVHVILFTLLNFI